MAGDSLSGRPPNIDNRTRAILEMALDAFVELDGSGLISDWNSKAEQTFGWTRSQTVGYPAQMLVPAADRETFQSVLRQCLAGTEQTDTARAPLQAKALHSDGHEFSI